LIFVNVLSSPKKMFLIKQSFVLEKEKDYF